MKKVIDIEHPKSGVVVTCYLDKTRFTCTVLERTFVASDVSVLKTQVLDFLDHWLTLEWFPVIRVEHSSSDGWGGGKKTGLWLTTERMFLSRSPAGKVLRVGWDVDPAHRKALCGSSDSAFNLASLPLGAPFKLGPSVTWMDYTESTWNSLQAIRDGIDRASAKLSDLVSTREGNMQLEAGRAEPTGLLPW